MALRKSNKLPLLKSESTTAFMSLCARLQEEIKPNGAVEEIYLEDIAALVWEIQRLRRFRISTIQQAIPKAINGVLEQLLFSPNFMENIDSKLEARRLTNGWVENDQAEKKQVREVLRCFGLDESAFEAEAMRASADQLEYFDRALVTARARLDRALRLIMDYRASFASRMRQGVDQILRDQHNQKTICIEHDAEQKSAA